MENRCPHCGAPLPLGSEICFDCGARISRTERDPWEREDRVSAKQNTGERAWRRDQVRQRSHERRHTAHSVSREAERDYEKEEHTYQITRPARGSKKEKPPPKNAQSKKAARSVSTARGKKRGKRTGFSLVWACVLLILPLLKHFGPGSDFGGLGGGESEYSYYAYSVTEEQADGTQVEEWYDSEDVLMEENFFDAAGNLYQTNGYLDGQLREVEYYDSEGKLSL